MDILITGLIILGVLLSIFSLPGVFIIVITMIIDNATGGDVPVLVIILFSLIAVLTTFLDNIFTLWGAKKYGASKWGMIGVFVGFLVGLITANPVIILVGPFAFAYLLESTLGNRTSDDAVKSAKGSVIGGLLGYLSKFFVTLVLALIYLFILR